MTTLSPLLFLVFVALCVYDTGAVFGRSNKPSTLAVLSVDVVSKTKGLLFKSESTRLVISGAKVIGDGEAVDKIKLKENHSLFIKDNGKWQKYRVVALTSDSQGTVVEHLDIDDKSTTLTTEELKSKIEARHVAIRQQQLPKSEQRKRLDEAFVIEQATAPSSCPINAAVATPLQESVVKVGGTTGLVFENVDLWRTNQWASSPTMRGAWPQPNDVLGSWKDELWLSTCCSSSVPGTRPWDKFEMSAFTNDYLRIHESGQRYGSTWRHYRVRRITESSVRLMGILKFGEKPVVIGPNPLDKTISMQDLRSKVLNREIFFENNHETYTSIHYMYVLTAAQIRNDCEGKQIEVQGIGGSVFTARDMYGEDEQLFHIDEEYEDEYEYWQNLYDDFKKTLSAKYW